MKIKLSKMNKKELRKCFVENKGLSTYLLAKKLGVHQTQISRYYEKLGIKRKGSRPSTFRKWVSINNIPNNDDEFVKVYKKYKQEIWDIVPDYEREALLNSTNYANAFEELMVKTAIEYLLLEAQR